MVNIKAVCKLESLRGEKQQSFERRLSVPLVYNDIESDSESTDLKENLNPEVIKQCYRVESSEIMSEAMKFANKGQFKKAENLL